jgi:transcription antitermination factor NusG
LFPGYLFVRLDLARPWHPVTYAPGVFQLLKTDGTPAVCPDTAVEAVRSAVDGAEALAASPIPWEPGTPCSLATGPLRGQKGVVLRVQKDRALVALMVFGVLRQVEAPLASLASELEG